jgi:hypothetical protein
MIIFVKQGDYSVKNKRTELLISLQKTTASALTLTAELNYSGFAILDQRSGRDVVVSNDNLAGAARDAIKIVRIRRTIV